MTGISAKTGAGGARSRLTRAALVASSPVLVCTAALAAVDLLSARPYVERDELAALCGYLILSAAVLGCVGLIGNAALAFTAARTAELRGWRARFSHLALAAVVALPASFFAGMVTAGQSISASRWRWPVYSAVVICCSGGALLLVRLRGRAPRWSALRRALAGIATAGAGGAIIWLTTFHATTYLGIHLVNLCISSVLIQVGLSFLPGLGRAPSPLGRAIRGGVLVLLVAAALGLSRQGDAARPQIGLLVFSDTVVAQKLSAMLFWASPIYSGAETARDDAFRGTRLDRFNAPPARPMEPGEYEGYNIVWLSADAFRSEMVGARRDGASLAPVLEELAEQSFFFDEATVDYSHTSRSVLSALSGRWYINFPSERVASKDAGDIADRGRLARVLRGSGYTTVADMMGGRWGEVFFDKRYLPGFDVHVRPGPTCVQQVDWLERYLERREASARERGKPLFLWMHIFDTHTPLQHPQEAGPFGGRQREEYEAAVRHVDGCVGRAVEALRKHGLWDETIFVFFGDHGEALSEHKRTLKHSTCYLHDIRIPLFFRLPGARGGRIHYRAQLSDLLPTVANLVGASVRGEIVEGDDLSGLFRDGVKPPGRGMAFTQGHPEQYPCAGVLDDRWHLIYNHAGRFYELYDVDADPGETKNLVSKNDDALKRLRPLLDAYFAKFKIRHRSKALRRPIPDDME